MQNPAGLCAGISRGVLVLAGGVPVLAGGVPVLAGGVPILAGGLPVLAGGLPVTAGYRQKNASRLNRQHNCSCVQWVYLPVKSRHMLVFASEVNSMVFIWHLLHLH